MIHLIRWIIRKLRRRTTSPAEAPTAVSGPDEPAVRGPGERLAASGLVTPSAAASGANRGGPAISVRGLSKRFGDRVAFQDVSFEIGYGEVFGFLGPNGAGKTTTVRTLGTLITPTSG
ncbi:MAG: ATP-binding cassette domain-containing protein, partial [Kitasatospora sp.]|nr:ATP-binding cassette domain-containing protein [Kitasatospora sp.]